MFPYRPVTLYLQNSQGRGVEPAEEPAAALWVHQVAATRP
jgi:hypothetical protein